MEKWALGFLIGHFLALRSPILLTTEALILLTLFGLLFFILLFNKQNRLVVVLVWFFSGIFSAVIWVFTCAHLYYQNDVISAINGEYQVHGIIGSRVLEQDDSKSNLSSTHSEQSHINKGVSSGNALPFVRFDVLVNTLTQDTGAVIYKQPSGLFASSAKVSVSWYQADKQVQQGDVVKFTARLNKAYGYNNSFGYDYRRLAFSQGVIAKGHIKGDLEVIRSNPSTEQQTVNLFGRVTNDLLSQPYLLALLLAEKSQLTDAQRTLLNHAGISHLFAISGLHIAIIFVLVKFIVQALLRTWSHHYKYQIVTLLALAPIWLYVHLLDYVISAYRAALLVTLWALLNNLFCHQSHFHRLLYIAVLSLIVYPFITLQPSWWLSFSAVLGILVFIEWQSSHQLSWLEIKAQYATRFLFAGCVWLWRKILLLVLFQGFIFVWMLPVTIYWFGGFSLSGLLVNLLVIPVFCLLLIPYLFVVSLITLLVHHVAAANLETLTMLYWPADQIISVIVEALSRYKWCRIWIDVANDSWPIFVVWALLLLTLCKNMPRWPSVITVLSAIGLPVITGLQLILSPRLLSVVPSGDLSMRVLDVGQGTSIVFQRNNRALVYDLGPVFQTGFSATQAVVLPNLIGHGVLSVDHLIISHQDADHKGDVNKISHLMAVHNVHFINSCPVHSFYWQGTKITPMWPEMAGHRVTSAQLSDNDGSCVIKVEDLSTGVAVLLTGDISKEVEKQLLQYVYSTRTDDNKPFTAVQAHILISAHHGSQHSSSYPMLKAVTPDLLIHTAGRFNRFNFPSAAVKHRVNMLNIEQVSTSDVGEILIEFGPKVDEFAIKFATDPWSPFWKKQNPFSFALEIR